jgi:hypothetical protein
MDSNGALVRSTDPNVYGGTVKRATAATAKEK